MGHRRRRREDLDDLGALAIERIRDALAAHDPDTRIAREAARAQRRREREEGGRRTLLATGVGLLAGGLAATQLETIAAVGLGLIAGAAVIYLLRPGRLLGLPTQPPPRRQEPIATDVAAGAGLSEARRSFIAQVLATAAETVQRLETAITRLPAAGDAAIARRLSESGRRLIAAIAADPGKLAPAQRLLTYHLEKAVFLVERLSEPRLTAARAQDLRLVLSRMDNLFEKTELDLQAGDGREMDLEVRLINQALDEDLGGEGARGPTLRG